MRTAEAVRLVVDRACSEGYDLSCPRCGSVNSVRVAAYAGGKPENWYARCSRCDRSFQIKKKAKEEKKVEVYQPQPAQQEATAQALAEKPPARTSLGRLRELLTKDEYLRLKEAGRVDRDIIKDFGTHPASFYALKKEWGLTGYSIPPAVSPKQPEEEKPVPLSLQEALQGVACPVPDQRISELEKAVEYLREAVIALREAALTRADVEEIAKLSFGNLERHVLDLADEFYDHRHQTGAGKWSGKAEV